MMTRAKRPEIRFADPFVRAELERTRDGRRALEHHAASFHPNTTPATRRHHRRTAQRLAKKVLS